MSERILILGNLGNAGFQVTEQLVKAGHDVTLGVNTLDFGMSMPEWELLNFDKPIDPYNQNDCQELQQYWTPPKWIRYFQFDMNLSKRPKGIIGRIKHTLQVRKMIQEYDIVEAHVPFSIITQFSGIDYVTYDAGWIRRFEDRRSIIDKLGERGYSKAKSIIVTNPDTLRIFRSNEKLKNKEMRFIPFAIDHQRYKKLPKNKGIDLFNEDEFIIFSPSRLAWTEKGNDRLIRAFARFVKTYPNSRLVIVYWSTDAEKSKSLVYQLGIASKVTWINPVSKPELIKWYSSVNVVADQFILGSWGSSTPEAMACEAPVMMYYNTKYIIETFGNELPPILNCQTEDQIYSYLITLYKDKDLGLSIGKQSRQWIIKTHDPKDVAQKHLKILQSHLKK